VREIGTETRGQAGAEVIERKTWQTKGSFQGLMNRLACEKAFVHGAVFSVISKADFEAVEPCDGKNWSIRKGGNIVRRPDSGAEESDRKTHHQAVRRSVGLGRPASRKGRSSIQPNAVRWGRGGGRKTLGRGDAIGAGDDGWRPGP